MGHVMEVQIKAQPGETVGSVIQKALQKCYPQPKSVPAPHTLRYTLGDFPSHVIQTQEQGLVDSPNKPIFGVEISLSHEDRLDWITIKDSTIIALNPMLQCRRPKRSVKEHGGRIAPVLSTNIKKPTPAPKPQ